jgi:hypothetical protein
MAEGYTREDAMSDIDNRKKKAARSWLAAKSDIAECKDHLLTAKESLRLAQEREEKAKEELIYLCEGSNRSFILADEKLVCVQSRGKKPKYVYVAEDNVSV